MIFIFKPWQNYIIDEKFSNQRLNNISKSYRICRQIHLLTWRIANYEINENESQEISYPSIWWVKHLVAIDLLFSTKSAQAQHIMTLY